MTTEVAALVGSGLLSLALAVLTIVIHFARYGGPMIRGNRDDFPPLDGLAARVVRAHANLNEALLPFAVLVFAAAATHVASGWTAYAAIGFLAARVAHAGLYLLGMTPWRSVAFYCGLVATLAFAAQLPLPG